MVFGRGFLIFYAGKISWFPSFYLSVHFGKIFGIWYSMILFITFPNKLARLSLSMSMAKSIFSQSQNPCCLTFWYDFLKVYRPFLGCFLSFRHFRTDSQKILNESLGNFFWGGGVVKMFFPNFQTCILHKYSQPIRGLKIGKIYKGFCKKWFFKVSKFFFF